MALVNSFSNPILQSKPTPTSHRLPFTGYSYLGLSLQLKFLKKITLFTDLHTMFEKLKIVFFAFILLRYPVTYVRNPWPMNYILIQNPYMWLPICFLFFFFDSCKMILLLLFFTIVLQSHFWASGLILYISLSVSVTHSNSRIDCFSIYFSSIETIITSYRESIKYKDYFVEKIKS